jgi:transposase
MIELVQAGRTPAELAVQFGVAAQSICTWVAREVARRGPLRAGNDMARSSEGDELARLRQENRRLQRECELLTRATAWLRQLPVNVDV